MTANGNEAVTLSQLKMFTESSNSGGGQRRYVCDCYRYAWF